MPLGTDRQYDISWEEQDKIRRRLAIKERLKQEYVRRKWDPFKQMKGEPVLDPAIERYMDLRKWGRLPGAPYKPSMYFSLLAGFWIPVALVMYAVNWERKDYLEKCSTGDYPYSKRRYKDLA